MGIADKLFRMKTEKMEKNKAEGAEFLAHNKEKEAVVALESGLQYEILEEGEGAARPNPRSKVTCHYEGKLLNGKVFDSSYKRGQPATFPLDQVIAGWTEGVQLMNEGAKYRFYIPYDLAYGERQVGSDIPPCSTLIFDVELIQIG